MTMSEHEIFQAAAAALAARAQLDQLLLDALAEPGMADDSSARLQVFLRGPLVAGRDALDRLVADAGGAA
jgi:hypothetical protein